MPTYNEFKGRQEYLAKYSGSAIGVAIFDELDPSKVVIGKVSGVNPNQNFEAIPIEEAGNDGVDEIVQGRHDGAMSVSAFWTPEWADTVPTRQNFIGKKYLILLFVGAQRPSEGVILGAYTGGVINNISDPFGARGARTFNFSFLFERQYSGQEWADLSGGVS